MIKNKSKYIILTSSILVLVTVLLSCDTSFNTVVKDFFYSEKVTIKVDGDGLSSTDLIGYKLTKSAYDFGYCTSEATKTLTFTAAEAFSISPVITGSSKFSAGSPSKSYVVKGEQFSITVTYTPSGTTWDEATLSLSSGNEDSYKITLIGSSFKQPKNVGSSGSLRLWLRADMIKSVVAETMQIKTLPDYSGSGFDAAPITLSDSPIYTSSGINGLPSITFSTGKTLVSEGTAQNPIVNQSNGTTTFVVFKVSDNISTQYILTCYSSFTTCFPGLSASYRYYDVSTGWSSETWKRCFAIYGYGYYGSYRYIFNDETGDSKVLENYTLDTPYSMCMKYDGTVDTSTKFPNTFIYQNGTKKFISYTFSNSTKSDNRYDSNRSPLCYGAYGKPASDGEGGRYGSLGNAAVDITSGSDWNTARTACSTRLNDFAFSYTPWITDSTASTSTYFKNQVSKTTTYNGTIKTVYLGPYTSTQYFSGQIAEVMVYNKALTDDEIKAVNNYIYYRYNIGSAQE